MHPKTIEDFLAELSEINGDDKSSVGMYNTIEFLKAGDELFDTNLVLQQKLNSGSFRQSISGNSFIKETFEGNDLKRPVIDLVQQGGTMLGIALLGYTYIMEKAGIRFRSMAGTSAGAINALLLSALPEEIYESKSPFVKDGRQAVKSEFLAYLVANKNFSEFLDRKGAIGRIQIWLIKRIKMLGKILRIFFIIFPVLLLGFSFIIYKAINGTLFTLSNGLTEKEIRAYDFITGTLGIVAIFLFLLFLLFRLFKRNMGINPGEVVYDWLEAILNTNFVNIKTTADLKKRKDMVKVINDNPDASPGSNPRVVFIAANLTHSRIVKFPDHNSDYWNPEYTDLVSPAVYVRASMSLPFIFYAFIPDDRHSHVPVETGLSTKGTLHTLARFVDGGMLSNFPIREFHVPPPTEPKYPTFGVLLGAGDEGNLERIRKRFWSESVFKFILSFISTFRNFYDKDFLMNHPEFKQLVKTVNTEKFNSLDFGMDLDTKKKLFAEGAKTAIEQLITFNWPDYLESRKKF